MDYRLYDACGNFIGDDVCARNDEDACVHTGNGCFETDPCAILNATPC